ncbi:MAG: hypothetical protein ABSD75_00020 [Terriglobales bacterium]|jgi:hypothetical protein
MAQASSTGFDSEAPSASIAVSRLHPRLIDPADFAMAPLQGSQKCTHSAVFRDCVALGVPSTITGRQMQYGVILLWQSDAFAWRGG